jgi:hypothetical protein
MKMRGLWRDFVIYAILEGEWFGARKTAPLA